MRIKLILLLVLVLSIYSLLTSKTASAEENLIKLSSFNLSRSSSAFLDDDGNPLNHPAGPSTGSTQVGYFLLNSFNQSFPSGCGLEYEVPKSYLSEGSLVDGQGNLMLDVFFATNTTQSFTLEEQEELKRFVNAGGILYLHTSASAGEDYFNPLLQYFGLDVSFGDRQQVSTGTNSSPLADTPTKNGPFGSVGYLDHGPFREINSTGVVEVAYSPSIDKVLLVETPFGNGYIAISGGPLHVNILATTNNKNYFGNLVSLACNRHSDNSIVLDVPSFKQGLAPYDGQEPYWEDTTYDNGGQLDLWCDDNGDGAKMYECACALTSASMVANYYGLTKTPLGIDLNPGYLNVHAEEILYSGGYSGFDGGNFRWSFLGNFSSYVHQIYPDQQKIEQPVRENFSVERVKQLIDGGRPVILKVNGGSHWVVVKGYDPDDNRLIINDPFYPDPPLGKYTYLDERYTPVASGSMIIYEKTESDYRYLEFATGSQNHLLVEDENGNKTGFDPQTGQIVKQIPNSDYALDEYYGQPTSEGIYYLTIKLPQDSTFSLQVLSQDGQPHDVQVYSSDLQGSLAGKTINPQDQEERYNLVYDQSTAGQEVNIEKVIEHIEVEVDIRPWSQRDWIFSRGLLPVPFTVYSSEVFDATSINQSTIRIGKTGTEDSLKFCLPWFLDVNRDGLKDLTCTFVVRDTGLSKGDTQAILTADTKEGMSVSGVGHVQVLR